MRGCLSTLQPCAGYGCEVWRGLDWLNDNEKILLDVSHYPELATKLHAAFDSQTGSGKHYDLAIQGRWSANATFSQPRQIDAAARIAFAIDLMPLFKDPTISLTNFALAAIERFKAQVKSQLT